MSRRMSATDRIVVAPLPGSPALTLEQLQALPPESAD